ncbi:MAG: hypothetical protein IJX77_04760 [Ruminococcus sp.]|nr:hypothetical protein [Ruminococcus sp.]
MKKILDNIWTKRAASLISALYAYGACYICYCSVFYNIEVSSSVSLCLLVSGISLLALVIMLYSRKQVLTRIASVVILPAMLPVVLLYFGQWGLIIPIIITGLIILLLSGSGEGFKTAFGTIFLLLYIFGALGYFLFTSFFVTASKTQTVKSGLSPSNQYRYYVVNTEDTSNGSTAVYVEPNYADLKYPFVTLTLKDMQRVVYLERPITETIDVQWTTQSRQEITDYLNSISDSITVHLTESQLKKLGYTYDCKLALTELTTEQKKAIGKTASDIDMVYLDQLTAEQLAYFGIGKDGNSRYYVLEPTAAILEETDKKSGSTVYFSELSSETQESFNVVKDDSVYLNTLTDENLAMLGVPESGDIMTFNGKVCFRYYVAVLENYFDVDDRSLSISLLS